MRVRGFPFGTAVREFLARHDRHIVIEQNRDGQLRSLLVLETGIAPERLLSIREYGGLPLGTNQVVDGILGLLQGVEAHA
jgi:2-oxoglutarate ferredoxin oxidoreductase subunit alpha